MKAYAEAKSIGELVKAAEHIVVLQADNPDGDSLGTSLALEQILSEQGKTIALYCAVDMPTYIRYLSGWDRVMNELSDQFDLSFIVDASTMTLFEKLSSSQQKKLSTKPCVIIDHHASTTNDIPFATTTLNDSTASSTGEVIYNLARELNWPLDETSGKFIMSAILGDTQGLTNDLARASTYRAMAELTELGVSRPTLEEQRREYSKMEPVIFKYKAHLIERTEFHNNGKIALVTIPQSEITEYSSLYNPAPLIQNDMLQTRGVAVAIVMKYYDDGKILGAIRCNPGAGIATELAEGFGGGGHPFASGFKILSGRSISDVKNECIKTASELLAKIK